ncbi:MAG: GNAT family N-acetyltransferase, partial [Aurantibacter sp.]
MEYTIREAKSEDMLEVLSLIQELAAFEKEDNAVEVTVKDLVRDGFDGKKLFHCFVGENKGVVV